MMLLLHKRPGIFQHTPQTSLHDGVKARQGLKISGWCLP
jgi:hypothetical protein